jgi:hypothetical protein
MTKVCDILDKFGSLRGGPDNIRIYDIRQMLWVLKIENWR